MSHETSSFDNYKAALRRAWEASLVVDSPTPVATGRVVEVTPMPPFPYLPPVAVHQRQRQLMDKQLQIQQQLANQQLRRGASWER